jgi:hypothetical protein
MYLLFYFQVIASDSDSDISAASSISAKKKKSILHVKVCVGQSCPSIQSLWQAAVSRSLEPEIILISGSAAFSDRLLPLGDILIHVAREMPGVCLFCNSGTKDPE